MLLDAYIYRSEGDPWRRPRGGTQHIRMKVGDMKKRSWAISRPISTKDRSSWVPGSKTLSLFQRPDVTQSGPAHRCTPSRA
jgi:hypothetical protein